MSDASEPRGLDRQRLAPWLARHVPGAEAPLRFELLAAGGSNLTYRVEAEGGEAGPWALRRPPLGRRLATAHDVGREWRILRALHGRAAGVPVPEPVAHCEDEAVTGAPFYVMGFVEGRVLRDAAGAAGLDEPRCSAAAESLVDAQVALHALDVDALGLGDLGRREGYVERQLFRWRRQVERARWRDLPLVDEVFERLSRAVPPQRGAALVHGDYRFDNTVLGPDSRVAAVLDWELAALGDPVADFCWSLLYWADPGDELALLPSSPTLHPGFPRRREVAARYAERSGRDLSELPFFTAFGWWKMACIVEGVLARLRSGGGGGMPVGDLDVQARRVEHMLERAASEAGSLA